MPRHLSDDAPLPPSLRRTLLMLTLAALMVRVAGLLLEPPVGPDEAFLNHLVGVVLVARQAERQPEDTPAVALDEHAEGLTVAGLGPLDESAVTLHEHSPG